MRTRTEGNRRIEIVETFELWAVRTSIVHNDIVHDLGFVTFYEEKDLRKFVSDFFACNDRKKD